MWGEDSRTWARCRWPTVCWFTDRLCVTLITSGEQGQSLSHKLTFSTLPILFSRCTTIHLFSLYMSQISASFFFSHSVSLPSSSAFHFPCICLFFCLCPSITNPLVIPTSYLLSSFFFFRKSFSVLSHCSLFFSHCLFCMFLPPLSLLYRYLTPSASLRTWSL